MSPPEAAAALSSPGGHAATACDHCGEPVPAARRAAERPWFCCQGCQTVYGVLHAHGLSGFYGLGGVDRPATVTERGFAELDDPGLQERWVRDAGDGLRAVDLYLEGVHCGACVWLVEKLPRLQAGVRSARLDLARGLAQVTWDPAAASLSQIAQTLDRIGYSPHPFRAAERLEARRAEDRTYLTRLAIAGALAGNVMLLSVALYSGDASGMESRFASFFRWAALALTVPAVLGPGAVFLRGAWTAIRTQTPHVDLPVALAIVVGLVGGAWNTWRGQGEVYFDTVTVLVFLLLVGRYLQHRQRRAAADATELLGSLAPCSARLLEGEVAREVPLETLRAGQQVEVRVGDAIPSDGHVVRGSSQLDTSLLTGEPWPRAVGPGDAVHAGTLNVGSRLVVAVERAGEETRIARLMRLVEEYSSRKAPVVQLADRIAGWFVVTVLLLAAGTLGLWWVLDPTRAIGHAMALLIVTCPCALALATPLAISAAMGRAASRGVVIQGGEVLQRLAQGGGRLWLDKTGTLTEGRARLLSWVGDDAARPWVLALEASSAHPIARGFQEAFADVPAAEPEEPPARMAGGLRGRVAGRDVLLGSPACLARAGVALPEWARRELDEALAQAHTPVLVAVDGALVALATFGDRVREEAADVLGRLRERGWRLGLLSGDHPSVVEAVGRTVGLDPAECHGGLEPEEKLAIVEREPALMVGDGVNDAAALAAATVGVGVHGGADATLAAADVFLSKPGLAPLVELLDLSRSALGRIRANFIISLTYNLLAAGLAIAGVITPLLAAVLMPISSLGVIANSYRPPRGDAWK